MGANELRAMWRENKQIKAAWLSTADGLIAETMGRAGFDALVLDMQHGMAIGPDRAAAWLQAVGNTPAAAIVRTPWNDPIHTQTILDAGADGVIVPLIASVEDARRAAGSCRYPPIGFRSWGPNRAAMRAGGDPYRWANEGILCFALIEHIDGVNLIEEIVKTPGLDGFFIGPNDLALSMGIMPGQWANDPEHIAAVKRVVDVARSNGKVVGNYAGGGPAEAIAHAKQGFNFCPVGMDVFMVRDGSRRAIDEFLAGIGDTT